MLWTLGLSALIPWGPCWGRWWRWAWRPETGSGTGGTRTRTGWRPGGRPSRACGCDPSWTAARWSRYVHLEEEEEEERVQLSGFQFYADRLLIWHQEDEHFMPLYASLRFSSSFFVWSPTACDDVSFLLSASHLYSTSAQTASSGFRWVRITINTFRDFK